MKQLSLVILLLCLSFAGYSQITAANYGFTATTGTFSSIASSGTYAPDATGDDVTQTDIPIGFPFNYCGVDYNTVSVCANGWVSLVNSSSSANYNNGGPTSMASGGVGFLMAYWDDLFSNGSGSVYYTTTGPVGSRKFIVEWTNYQPYHFSTPPGGSMSIQVILYEGTNVIEYVYSNGTFFGASGTIGIANSTSDYQTLSDVTAAPIADAISFYTSLDASPAEGQIYRFTPPPPCSGSITAGVAHVDLFTGCTDQPVTLNVTGTTASTGITFQWQVSTDGGGSWSDILGGTTNPYIASMPGTDASFRAIATCTASGYTDSTAQVDVAFSPVCYCTPSYYYSPSTGTYTGNLSEVQMTGYLGGTIDDLGPTTVPDNGYEDRTDQVITFQQGNAYAGTLTYGYTVYAYQSQIWIDFNDDGTFDASEAVTPVISSGISSYASSDNFNITIPLTAAVGSHRMRVRYADMQYPWPAALSPSMDPCYSWDGYNTYYYGITRDYYANIVAAPACAGVPDAGTIGASPAVACPSSSFDLSASGYTIATGLTFQWQYSSTGAGPWTAIDGATNTSYTGASESSALYYQLLITCAASATSDTSNAVLVNYFGACVCTPTYSSSPASGSSNGIDLFTLTGEGSTSINDPVTSPAPSSGYADRTSISIDLQQGNSYSGTISYLGTYNNYQSQVWIDFNDDGVFDISEEVTPVIYSYAYASSDNFTLTVPVTGALGLHRMRVRYASLNWGGSRSADVDPCNDYDGTNTYWNGIARDYLVNILPAPPCSGTPTAGTVASSATLACPATSFNLSNTGSTVASGLTYQWQSATSASGPWTDIMGATNTTYSLDITAPTYFHLVVTCPSDPTPAVSDSVFVNYYGFCYCVPSYASSPAAASWYNINMFNLSGYSGSSISDAGTSPFPSTGYDDRTSITIDLQQGVPYSGNISYGSTNNSYESQVWIDFNDNGTFETGEEVTPIINTGAYASSSDFTLTVPLTGAVGLHRMRVRYSVLGWGSSVSSDMDPCASSDASNTYWNGMTRDYMANIIALPNCSGAPTIGTVTASPTSGGAGTLFNLSAPGVEYAIGLTFQWQSASSASGPWTDIPGATTTSYSFISIYADSFFRFTATCTLSGGTVTNGDPITLTYVPTPPCFPDVSSWNTFGSSPDYGIDAFSVGTFGGGVFNDAGIQSAAAYGSGYLDRTSMDPITMEQSGVYAASGSWSPADQHQIMQVWIDFNDDGVFETTEEVSPVSGYSGYPTPNPTLFNVTIPSTAHTGIHNMRVRALWEENATDLGGVPPAHLDPCRVQYYATMPRYWSGDVIDYRVNIIQHCTFTASASASAAVCPGSDFTLTGATTAPTYSWSGPGGYSSTNLVDVVSGITSAQTYTFVATDGSCSYSLTATQSLLPAPAAAAITPSVGSVCNNDVLPITATTTPMLSDLIPVQDFETGVPTDPSTPVDGWTTNAAATDYITQESSGMHPSGVGPESGSYFADFHSWSYGSITAALISPAIDLTGVTGAQVSFWVYRDDASYYGSWGYTTEGWTVYVNTSTDISSATSLGFVPRAYDATTSGSVSGPSTVSTHGWYQYTVDIPASFAGTSNYVFLQGTSQYGNDCYIDNVHVTGYVPIAAPTWSPSTYLYTDAGTTSSYTSGTPAASLYMHPTSVPATTTVNYVATVTNGTCSTSDTVAVTIHVVSAIAVTGSTSICAGNTVSLSNPDAGGTWSLSNTSVATINASGVVTGLGSGVDTAYYTVGGCSSYVVINVSTVVTPITGATSVCTGGITTTLSNTTTGGTWSGGNTSIATVNGSGVVTSVAAGTTIVTYTLPGGCVDTALITVVAPPAAITGTASVCYAGGTTTLSDATTGGTWSSSSPLVASVNTSGVVTGLTSGSATITYTTLPGCYAVRTLTLNANPPAITGTTTVCAGGAVTTLADAGGTGTWTSGSTSVATVNSSGVVTGVSSGNAAITFTASNGCYTTATVTVNSIPSPITGASSVCYPGGTTTLSDATGSGTWSSSASGVATVTGSGMVTGVGSGSVTITYTGTNGCFVTHPMTLNANPPAITGTTTVCAGGATTTLADAGGAGTWSSGATSIATVNSSGVVTGVTAGNAPVTFTDGNGCVAVATVTVNALPAAITGTTTICDLASTTLSDASTPGTWSTTTPSITTVNGSGMVTGVSAGVGTIVFTQTSTGCSRSATVTVNALPTSISGVSSLCNGTTTTFTGNPTPGTWSASPLSVATIESGTGILHTVSAGTVNVTYTNGVGCYISTPVTVNASFVPSVTINANPGTSVCDGTTASYSATITNGGSTPTYAWTVNSAAVSSSPSYSYTPANGDVVGLTITSSLACAIPVAATAAVTMTVNPVVYPTLNISGTHGDTACNGTPVTINTYPSSVALSPTYQWILNGTPVATGSSYTYNANNGDVLVAVMTSGAACISGSSSVITMDTLVMDVLPYVTPMVTLTSSTGSTACTGNLVSFTADGTNGGSAPAFLWSVNGVNVATGPTYYYMPTDGDLVNVTMTSNYVCVSPATDTAQMTMSVITGTAPVVVMTTTYAGAAFSGVSDTFNVNIISGGGTTPAYQWYVNGIPVTGANGPSYATDLLSAGDVVTCRVTNTEPCGGTTTSNAVTVESGVGVGQVSQGAASISLMPNPNKGIFTVKGNIGMSINEDMVLEVTDMVGQMVYTGHTQAKNGEFTQQVQLSGLLSNGMYILNVRSQHMSQSFHFVLDQQ